MGQGKYTAADIDKPAGGMPNAGPMGKYTSADVDSTPTPADDDPISRFFQGAGNRIKGMAEGMTPQGADEIIGGPGYKLIKGAVQGAKGAYDSARKSAEEGDVPGSMLKSVAAAVPLVGPGAASIYDRAKSGDTAGAMGMGGVDALAMLLPTKGGEVADVATDAAAHPIVRGAGRVVRDFDITKPFKSIGENVAGPAMDRLSQMRAARGRPQLQSPLDPSAGVRVQGGGVQSPRIPSPAEDLISAMDNESAVRRAPDTHPAPAAPQVRVKHLQEGIQSPLEPGTGTVQPRQFGDPPVSNQLSLLHGTSLDLADSILNDGLVPNKTNPTGVSQSGKVYLTSKLNKAEHYADHPEGSAIFEVDPSTPVIRRSGEHGDVLHEGAIPPDKLRLHSARSAEIAPPSLSSGSMQPTADMNTGGGGANYSADDLANLISKHNIPPAPGEIVGAAPSTPRPTGIGESLDDAAILQAMREDLDAHGRNALHEESTDFAARNKVGRGKTGKPGYGFNRKLPEAE